MQKTKTVKLSANMKEVVRKMRDGYAMRWESRPCLIKKDAYSLAVPIQTARCLFERGIINQGSCDYYLTELGQSISL